MTADGLSKKGVTAAHFDMTVHFVCKDGILRKACLAMLEFPPPHTAAAISDLTRSTLMKMTFL